MTLFEKLSKQDQQKVTQHFDSLDENLNTFENLNKIKCATALDVYTAIQVFCAILPTEKFDVIKFYMLFD